MDYLEDINIAGDQRLLLVATSPPHSAILASAQNAHNDFMRCYNKCMMLNWIIQTSQNLHNMSFYLLWTNNKQPIDYSQK